MATLFQKISNAKKAKEETIVVEGSLLHEKSLVMTRFASVLGHCFEASLYPETAYISGRTWAEMLMIWPGASERSVLNKRDVVGWFKGIRFKIDNNLPYGSIKILARPFPTIEASSP